ncbi:hypothetical protein RUM44_013718 [Polyplax serrata]|uniref:Uncharacterized protein n=1 Tax=Polyplax serrata TaxID=468196 RepID=A0ABR1BH57_POLSC
MTEMERRKKAKDSYQRLSNRPVSPTLDRVLSEQRSRRKYNEMVAASVVKMTTRNRIDRRKIA